MFDMRFILRLFAECGRRCPEPESRRWTKGFVECLYFGIEEDDTRRPLDPYMALNSELETVTPEPEIKPTS